MVYSDKPGRRIRRPLRRRTPQTDVDDAKTRYILEIAAKHPRATPEEVHAEIRSRGRHDITKAMVRYVLQQRRKSSRRSGR